MKTDQLNIFSNIHCHVCGEALEISPKNTSLLEGFRDADTNQYCHHGACQDEHYRKEMGRARHEDSFGVSNSNWYAVIKMFPVLKIQPAWCRAQLPLIPVDQMAYTPNKIHLRVIQTDPRTIYSRNFPLFDPYARSQKISIASLFPNTEPNKCACGCGLPLTGKRTRWATDDCSKYAGLVHRLICSASNDDIRIMLLDYYGSKCNSCGNESTGFAVDHKLAVCNGGGGSWLSNYQLLCDECHVLKTKEDIRIKKERLSNQIILIQ